MNAFVTRPEMPSESMPSEQALTPFNLSYLENHPDPWVRYRTLLDLCGAKPDDPLVRSTRLEILRHPQILGLLDELACWPGIVLSSHKSAGQLYHKLSFLAEIGLDGWDDPIAGVIGKIRAHLSDEGLPRLTTNIPVHFGGTGQDQSAWALCDTPLLLWILMKMDPAGAVSAAAGQDPQFPYRGALGYLAGLARANGWPCVVSKELGHFRGPGRKDDPCPYATLLMLKLLLDAPASAAPDLADTFRTVADAACASLLDLWQNSMEKHPYQFYMGTDFRKLKAPLVWYDLLNVLDVLSRSAFAVRDSRFAGMLQVMNRKAGPDGLFTPESEWKAWSAWEFGQKKKPSAWLTFLVYRINRRAEGL